MLRPAHGSYKSSQLLVRAGSVFLVDFDQFCLADPALDVGYFLAYLRPPGSGTTGQGRGHGSRPRADDVPLRLPPAPRRARRDAGDPRGHPAARHVFEAALLLKIAARRANRLHSPRPGEVQALLAEVTSCLDAAGVPPPADGDRAVR